MRMHLKRYAAEGGGVRSMMYPKGKTETNVHDFRKLSDGKGPFFTNQNAVRRENGDTSLGNQCGSRTPCEEETVGLVSPTVYK